MKHLILVILCSLSLTSVRAQGSRVTTLQNAHNLVVTTAGGRAYHYLVSADQNYVMHRAGGLLTIAGDTFAAADVVSMRFVSLPRFSLSEDSTAVSGNYAVERGLLAYRRTFNLSQWNTIVVPFSLTGQQVREAFGDDTLLARMRAVTEGDEATVEFETVDLSTDDAALLAGVHYLIRPTRKPDLMQGVLTTVAYGAGRISGPLYVIPNVSMAKGQTNPDNQALRSAGNQVRVRFRGTYGSREDNPYTTSSPIYQPNGDGRMEEAAGGITPKAFRSWIELVKNTANVPVRFYVDGINEDITAGIGDAPRIADSDRTATDAPVYDLLGRRVAIQGKGLYIQNGRKFFNR